VLFEAMHIASSLAELAAMLPTVPRIAVAIGVFDGVHRGHQAILAALQTAAARHDCLPVVITFDPHPRAILQSEPTPRLLTARDQKLAIFARHGIAATVFLPFSETMAALSPRQFIKTQLAAVDGFIAAVCVGAPWRFGRQGQGNVPLLTELGREFGFEVVSVAPRQHDGLPISSTRIRAAVEVGDLATAEQLLGRRYQVYGHVSHGRGVGHKQMQCPTANLADSNILLPPCGVYAARASIDPGISAVGKQYQGIAYIGSAPTVAHARGEQPGPNIIELHLFAFNDCLYEHTIEIEFVAFLRTEHDFADVEQLRRQIQADILAAEALLAPPAICSKSRSDGPASSSCR